MNFLHQREWFIRKDQNWEHGLKDKKSWEILRTQHWLYGKKDESFSEGELVSGI